MSFIEKEIGKIEEDVSNQLAQKMLRDGNLAFAFVLAAALGAIAIYCYKFGFFSLTEKRDDWGTFGDFLGGLLNPIVGIVTVFLVLLNARLQRLELRNSLREMKNTNSAMEAQNRSVEAQESQSTFFNWLSAYRGTVADLRFVSSSGFPEYCGQSALFNIYRHYLTGGEVSRMFSGRLPKNALQELLATGDITDESDAKLAESIILQEWKIIKRKQLDNLEVPMSSIVALMEWIYSGRRGSISAAQKNEFFKILKSQLSTAELAFLFYESWTMNPGPKLIFKTYKIFDRLPIDSDHLLKFMLARASHLK